MSHKDLSAGEKRALLKELLRRKAGEGKSFFPLSRGQQSLWFMQQLAPQSAAYNLMYAWRIRSGLNLSALGRAAQALVNRHASLRTVYGMDEGKPVQRVLEYQPVAFGVEDATGWCEERVRRGVTEAAHRPFDLGRDCLLRVNVYTRGPRDHILHLTFHHIGVDFPSVVRLVDELFTLYAAEANGSAAHLAAPARQYTDFVEWQAKLLEGAEGERLWGYWRDELSGELPVLNLQTDRPRPPAQTYGGDVEHFKLDDDTARRLRGFAKGEGLTPYVVLLAAFYALLYRYTGQEDILVGSPFDDRARAEFEQVVGYFVNPVVLRARPRAELTARQFLQKVRRTVLSALEHQDYPFALLVERLQPTRDPSRSPLCDIMFIMQKTARGAAKGRTAADASPLELLLLGESGARAKAGGLEVEAFKLTEQVSQLDMTLMMVDTGERIYGCLPYNTDLFDRETMTRLGAHYRTLLAGMLDNPDARLVELPLLSSAEERRVLHEWNETTLAYPEDQCVHQLFERQAKRTPQATAVVCESERLTYEELNGRANQLAHHLHSLGVGPEMRVGLCVGRSVRMIVGLLGALKAGGAYVPLDPTYPAERLAYMLEDARAGVLLAEREAFERLPPIARGTRVVLLDEDWETIARQSRTNPEKETAPTNLAYVVYTSGSTGRPKGVMVEHRSVVNLAAAHGEAIYKRQRGRALRATLNPALAFDACIERVLLLLSGHAVHVTTDEVRRDPAAFLDYAAQQGLDALDFTPSHLRLLVEAGLLERQDVAARVVIVGGEAVDEQLWRRLTRHAGVEFYNVYGPTECTVNATYRAMKDSPSSPVIGRPLPNVKVYLLDAQGRAVPPGLPGEIYVGGAGVARGYLNAPGLTAERFLPDPYSQVPGARRYKTSDLARYLPDGSIEFLGRNDEQIKLRGFRIEPGEIASVLGEFEGVKEALVLAAGAPDGDKCLAAYLVAETGVALAPTELKRFLRSRVPEYMVPASFTILDALPLTPNGKVDRRALPPPLAQAEEFFVAPRNSIEDELARMCGRVVGRERVGVHDNFFDLGGHSILATQLVMRAREVFDVDLPLRAVFESPTVAGLALAVIRERLVREDAQEIERLLDELESAPEESLRGLLDNGAGNG